MVISGAFKSIGVYQDIDDKVRNEAHQLLKLVECLLKRNNILVIYLQVKTTSDDCASFNGATPGFNFR